MKSSSRLAYPMKTLAMVVVLILNGVAVYAQEMAASPLQSSMTAFLVETNDEGKEVLTKTEQVKPGQVIEYVLLNSNVTDADLSEVNLVGPIPTGTSYLAGTASTGQYAKPEFSVDGGNTFQQEPIKYMVKQADGTEKETIATPDMYTHVRWTIGTMKARLEMALRYRVQVR